MVDAQNFTKIMNDSTQGFFNGIGVGLFIGAVVIIGLISYVIYNWLTKK